MIFDLINSEAKRNKTLKILAVFLVVFLAATCALGFAQGNVDFRENVFTYGLRQYWMVALLLAGGAAYFYIRLTANKGIQMNESAGIDKQGVTKAVNKTQGSSMFMDAETAKAVYGMTEWKNDRKN